MRAAIAIALVGCTAAPRAPEMPRTRTQQDAAAVRVDVLCIDSGHDPFEGGAFTAHMRIGSGVVVGPRHVLTASHVTACPFVPRVRITFADGSWRSVVVDREDAELDIARLEVSAALALPFSRPSTAAATRGDSACAMTSYPERGWSCGLVDEVATTGPGGITFGALTKSGNSGSGLYDGVGRLTGIVIAKVGDDTGKATAVPQGWVP